MAPPIHPLTCANIFTIKLLTLTLCSWVTHLLFYWTRQLPFLILGHCYNWGPFSPQVHASSITTDPGSHLQAIKDSNWRQAMNYEYTTLIENRTWTHVPRPLGSILWSLCGFFCHKHNADRTLSQYKACLVANCCSQQYGIDRDEIFSLIVKSATIHTVVSIAVSR